MIRSHVWTKQSICKPSHPDCVPSYEDESYGIELGSSSPSSTIVRPSTKVSGGKTPFRAFTPYYVYGSDIVNTPGIRTKITEGAAAFNVDRREFSYLNGSCDFVGSTEPPGNLRSELLNTAYANMRDEMFDALTSLGELPEVAAMLAKAKKRLLSNVGDSLTTFFSLARRGKIDIDMSFGAFSNWWLEYRYGWRPLISEVKQLHEAVQKVKLGSKVILTGRAQRSFEFAASTPVCAQFSARNLDGMPTKVASGSRTVTFRACVQCYLDPGEASFSANPVVTAWELVPWSFVVDWFLNVGDFLKQLSPRPPTLQACFSTSVEDKWSIHSGDGSGGFEVDTPAVLSGRTWSYNREVVSPDFPLVPPQPRVNLDVLKLTDIYALYLQRLNRR